MLQSLISILLCLLIGCTSYHPRPLPQNISSKQLTDIKKNGDQHVKINQDRTAIALDLRKPLNSKELAVIAVLMNPDLKALRSKEGVATAQIFDAGLLPDPKLNLSFDKYLHQTNPITIPISNAYLVGLGWDLMSLITRQSKIKIAKAKYEQVYYDIAWQEWLIANQVELLATRTYFLKQQISVTNKFLSSAKKLLDLSRVNLKRHDLTIDAYTLRESAYLDIQDQLQMLQGQLNNTQLQLNQNLGIPPAEHLEIAKPKTFHMPVIKPDDLYTKAFTSRFDLIALRAGYNSQEQTIYQNLLTQFPNFVLFINRSQDTGAINALGPSVSFDIPIFNKNRGTIAIAKATREQLYQEYKARLFKTQADIATLITDIQRLDNALFLLNQSLPKLRNGVTIMYQGLKHGNITETAYQDAKAGLFKKEITLLTLKQSKAEQMIALQIALGRPWNEVIKHAHKK